MTSVVIAAYDEEAVIGRSLDTLLAGAGPGELDVTVVANGCRDRTAEVARSRGVRVLDLPEGSKPRALNAGDQVAQGFPRVYLDADILVEVEVVRALAAALASDPALCAAVPRRELATSGRPLLVRAYFAVHAHHPAFRDALFGRGIIALSAEGRARFNDFPDAIADDLYLDSRFTAEEKRVVSEVSAVVATPYRTSDLIARLVRVRRGNAEMRERLRTDPRAVAPRPLDRWGWLWHSVAPRPWLAPAALGYLGLTLVAARRARRSTTMRWERDSSTRGDNRG